jgi:hypothetical protein
MTEKRSLDEIAADIKAILTAAGVSTQPRDTSKKVNQPTRPVKRGLPNQHGRLPKDLALAISFTAGVCPSCSMLRGLLDEHQFSVIYRRSATSVTFRCRLCGLKWTVTLANLHKVASARAANHAWYRDVAFGTKFAVERAAKRRNTITRQRPRRVIRLGNGER